MLQELREILPYAPAHLANETLLVETLGKLYPDLKQIAYFNTAFHHDLPRIAKLLAILLRFEGVALKLYVFHGISYTYLMAELSDKYGSKQLPNRIILAHLENLILACSLHQGS